MERHPITFLPTGRRKVADGCAEPLGRSGGCSRAQREGVMS